MKTIGFSLVLVCWLQASLEAQTNSPPASSDTNAPAASVAPTVVARSADSRVWARITSQTNAAGQVSLVTNKAYTELASGLCVQGPDGTWTDAVPVIAPDNVLGGASATGARHRVHFANDSDTAGGAIHFVSPDGNIFDSRVYGLSYRDLATGSNVLIASLQSSQGQVLGDHRVVYLNAFSNLQADLEYVYTLAGLEQNLVLRESPGSPAAYGLNPATTKMQIYTEFFSSPAPVKTSIERSNVAEDVLLDFGAAKIGMGQVFSVQAQGRRTAIQKGRVAKHWTQLDGNRQFLIEEIPYGAISNALQKLPLHAANGTPGKDPIPRTASLFPLRPKEAGATAQPGVPILVAKAETEGPGLLLDYSIVGANLTNYLFQSDSTYYVSGATYLYGASNIFEGGTVVKYGDSGTLIATEAPFVFNTGQYRPAVFTSVNDESVGQEVSAGYYSGSGCYLQTWSSLDNVSIEHVRIWYAGTGFDAVNDDSDVFRHCQFMYCQTAVELDSASWAYFGNILMHGCSGGVLLGNAPTIAADNMTVDFVPNGFDITDGASWGGIENSLFSGGTPYPDENVYSLNCCAYDPYEDFFQMMGEGSFYLANGSPYHNAGTSAIDETTLADLKTMTTYPPVVYSGTSISTAMTLGIAAPRDSGTPGLDLGYHYDPLDYVFGGVTVNSNVTFTAGTAVGWYNPGQGYGILMSNRTTACFQGTATATVWWVRANTVQEGNGGVWPGAGSVGGLVSEEELDNEDIALSPHANLFFTRCSILGSGDGGGLNHFRDNNGYLIVNAQNSEFHGGCLGGDVLSCYFTNCLVDRMLLAQVQGGPGNAFILTNCTFHGGELTLTPNNTPIPIAVRNCAFDGAIITASSYGANSSYASYDDNAFTNTAGKFPIGGTHDKIVTNGFNWQRSWFGNYYLPSDSPLIRAGVVTADKIGLYHFTTQTNQTPETNAVVDIGYHYVATDGSGTPLDTYWLGIPDYLADSNGALGAWEMSYFGHLGLDPNASDGQGNTLLHDYQNGLEPTIISFQISFTNQYVNLTNAPLSLAIQSGVPYYWAVLLDNTNFGGATWTAYTSSNITANLGTVQGWHTVWVGLSGRPAGSQAAWNAVRLDLDLTAPILTVTNNTSVTIPMIQLQGYANEELAWITYDLNNANGSVSNQPGFMTGAIFDTNSFAYTNDSFKCFDLALASGANTVTLHASDLAGNSTNCTVTFNLDYSSKPAPVVTLWWPTNGAQISGSSFTWRGTVDDPTVTLSAQITDASGDTNGVAGVIERNGNFWVDNIPLAPGTNWLTLTAVDINNNTNTTNILVVQSSVALNITYIDPITTQSAITVSGTISTNIFMVWVNGVMATNLGWNGAAYSWSANNVPVNGAGSAVIQARAIPNIANDGNGNGTGPGGGGNKSSLSNPGNPPAPDAVDEENDPDKLPVLYCSYFRQNWTGQSEQLSNPGLSPSVIENDSATTTWNSATGGTTVSNQCSTSYGTNGMATLQLSSVFQCQWATNGLGTTQYGGSTNAGCGNVANLSAPGGYVGPTSFPGLQGGCVFTTNYYIGNTPTVWNSSQQAASQFMLQTGGRSLSGGQSLHAIAAEAYAIQPPVYENIYPDWLDNDIPCSVYVPPGQVTILGLPENPGGFVWVVLPDGDEVEVTPQAPSVPFYFTAPVECKYAFVPQCQATFPTNQIRTNVGLGEIVNISYQPVTAMGLYSFGPTLPPDTIWSNSDGTLAYTNWPDNIFTAPGTAETVAITTIPGGYGGGNQPSLYDAFLTVSEQQVKAVRPSSFAVVSNTGIAYDLNNNQVTYSTNQAGAATGFNVSVLPTNASFSQVYFRELPGLATSITGYFASTNYTTDNSNTNAINLNHTTAGNWFRTTNANIWNDAVWSPTINPPYSNGGFQWVISNQYTTATNVPGRNYIETIETFTLDPNGTVTITKFGSNGVTRMTNGYTTFWCGTNVWHPTNGP